MPVTARLRALVGRGVAGSLLLLVGALVAAPMPASSPVGQLPLLAFLRDSHQARMLALALLMLGIGLLATAWLGLGRELRRSPAPERSRLRTVFLATTAWTVPLLLAPPLFSRDGWSYAAQGMQTFLGISPYEWGPAIMRGPIVEGVETLWLFTPAPYGPAPLIWGGLGASVVGDPYVLVVWHRLLAVSGIALMALALPRLARLAGRDPVTAAWLVLPSPILITHGVGGLHNDVFMAGLMVLAMVLVVERRLGRFAWVAAAMVGGLAAAVKIPGGLVCVGVALASLAVDATVWARLRRLVAVAAVAFGTLIALGAVSGLGAGWLQALAVPSVARTPLSLSTQLGWLAEVTFRVLDLTWVAESSVTVVRAIGSVAALILVTVLALRAPTGSFPAVARWTAGILLAFTALSPVIHFWYLLWFLPLACATWTSERATKVLTVVMCVGGLVAPLDPGLVGLDSRGLLVATLLPTVGLVLLFAAGSLRRVSLARRPAVEVPELELSR